MDCQILLICSLISAYVSANKFSSSRRIFRFYFIKSHTKNSEGFEIFFRDYRSLMTAFVWEDIVMNFVKFNNFFWYLKAQIRGGN